MARSKAAKSFCAKNGGGKYVGKPYCQRANHSHWFLKHLSHHGRHNTAHRLSNQAKPVLTNNTYLIHLINPPYELSYLAAQLQKIYRENGNRNNGGM